MNDVEAAHEKLQRLRIELKAAQEQLIEAEAERTDQLAEVTAFEREVERQLGLLIDQLATVESEIRAYNRRMERMRNKESFGMAYDNIEEQFRRTWEVPPPAAAAPPPEPPSPADEQQIKRLYRQLARRFHPDLAGDPAERAYRTEKMTAINDAYAARSLAELVALSEGQDITRFSSEKRGQTEEQMVRALEEELERIRHRLRQIRFEIDNLPNRSSIQLSLEVKLARRQGRDLLAEMVVDLEKKLARKSAERDFLKSQFDQLGPQPVIRGRGLGSK